jgi:hypothetical protein
MDKETSTLYNLVKKAEAFARPPETADASDQVKFGLGAVQRKPEDDARLRPPSEDFVHRPANPIPN